MDLKFYLNKFIKVDNIEGYTLKALNSLQRTYEDYLEKTEGSDPDFPMMTFGDGDKTTKRIKGTNAAKDADLIIDNNPNESKLF